LKIAIKASTKNSTVIRELLSPWDISFTEPDVAEATATIFYGEGPAQFRNAMVIPSNDAIFADWVNHAHMRLLSKSGLQTLVQATETTELSITPQTLYSFEQSTPSTLKDDSATAVLSEEDAIFLKIDVVNEFNSILKSTLNAKQSTLHQLVTELPIPYGLCPKFLRNKLMKSEIKQKNSEFSNKLPMDALRFVLVNALEKLTGTEIKKKMLFDNNYLCLLTHDVESAQGLKRAQRMKKMEEKYNCQSSWYLPSSRYTLNNEAIMELANYGEIGAHDTKHDGKLAHLSKNKLVSRLTNVREHLNKIVQQPITGFRAPILQHNDPILEAVSEAGYLYDTSIPTWEPKHPYTMKPHGIGTVFPLNIRGITEIPLTLTQDHQLINVLGLSKQETLRTWSEMALTIRDLGGVCMFLVHPDYEFADGSMELYEEILNHVTSDNKAILTLPSRTCEIIKGTTEIRNPA
jgi:peptidoglycan/xylan/chitin deacetylase (PgdA/CDA1 family)